MTPEDNIRRVLSYDAATGAFTWLETIQSRALKGCRAGTVNKRAALVIQIGKRTYQAKRLAFLLHLGAWPDRVVISKDKDLQNLRFSNLVDTTKSRRMHRRDQPNKQSSSGLVGAHKHKKSGKWVCQFRRKDVRRVHYGIFETPEEAHQEYLRQKQSYEERKSNDRTS